MAGDRRPPCDICRGEAFDAEFGRTLVWRDELWRLATSVVAPIVGFSYLEPIRHISDISDLDGREAETFGPALSRVTRLLKALTGADVVYALMFGDHIAHLHVNLVPHRAGDAVTGGATLIDPAAPALPRDVHDTFVTRLRAAAGEVL
jgi:diadenosine tetraphosphate (Ap4A) HIT family hydrolase